MPQALTWTSDQHLGCDRVVRSARRARLLRKRGVALLRLCDTKVATGRQSVYWVWSEHEASYASRKMARERKSAAKRSMRAAGWPLRLDWVERLLDNVAKAYHTRLKECGYLVEYTPTTPEARARRESPPGRLLVRVGGFEQLDDPT